MGLKSIRFTKRGVVKGVVSGRGNSTKRGYNGRKKVHAHHVRIYGPIIGPFSRGSIWLCICQGEIIHEPLQRTVWVYHHFRHITWIYYLVVKDYFVRGKHPRGCQSDCYPQWPKFIESCTVTKGENNNKTKRQKRIYRFYKAFPINTSPM